MTERKVQSLQSQMESMKRGSGRPASKHSMGKSPKDRYWNVFKRVLVFLFAPHPLLYTLPCPFLLNSLPFVFYCSNPLFEYSTLVQIHPPICYFCYPSHALLLTPIQSSPSTSFRSNLYTAIHITFVDQSSIF